jgi:DNA-binding CsgD family transcriptional regulator
MRHSPGYYRRLARLALDTEAGRLLLCVTLLAALWALGLPWWLIVILPIVAYVGMRMAVTSSGQADEGKGRNRLEPPDEHDAYETCKRLWEELESLSSEVTEEAVAERVRAVNGRIEKILAVIVEDARYPTAVPLLGLVTPTHELLSRYLKVVRRQLADDETHLRVRDNLSTIESAYDRFWVQLNRDTIVDLQALGETIDFTLKELGTPMELAPGPEELPGRVDDEECGTDGTDVSEGLPLDSAVPDGEMDASTPPLDGPGEPPALPPGSPASPRDEAIAGVALTPRELEVLCLIADGRSNQEIAVALFISIGTTKRHVTNILEKLRVPSRSAAAAFAHRHGVCPAADSLA